MKEFYVYTHSRATDMTVFYVGKGRGVRAHKTYGRNSHWQRIVDKYGLVVTIVKSGLTEQEAFDEEIALISHLGKDNLCNMTDGGEGTSGHVHAEETKIKQSLSAKLVVRSEERLSNLRKLNVGRKASDETRAKLSAARLGKKHSQEAISKMRDKANNRSAETVRKQVAANTGKKRSKDSVENMRNSQKGISVTCSNGKVFEKIAYAKQWLIDNGHPKASVSHISRAATETHRVAYGFRWAFTANCD